MTKRFSTTFNWSKKWTVHNIEPRCRCSYIAQQILKTNHWQRIWFYVAQFRTHEQWLLFSVGHSRVRLYHTSLSMQRRLLHSCTVMRTEDWGFKYIWCHHQFTFLMPSYCNLQQIKWEKNFATGLLSVVVVVVASHSHRENPCRNYIVPFWRACGNSMKHSSVHNSFESITFAISHTPLIKTQRFHFHIHGWTYIIQSFYGRSSETPLNGVLGKPKKL